MMALSALLEVAKRIFPSGKTRLAVELGNEWMKFAECTGMPRGSGSVSSRSLRLPVLKDEWPAALSGVLRSSGPGRKEAIVCLPRHSVSMKILDIPSRDSREISNIIGLQIGKQTPYSRDEIVYAYKALFSTPGGSTRVMLAVVRRSLLEECFRGMHQAGLEPMRVVLSSEAVCQLFAAKWPGVAASGTKRQAAVILDIDAASSEFIVVDSSGMLFSRTILFGARYLLGKKEKCFGHFLDEIKHSLQIFHEELSDSISVSSFFLSGAAGRIEDLPVFLRSGLGIDCRVVQPGSFIMDSGAFPSREDADALSFTALYGALSARGEPELDLMPPEIRSMRNISADPRHALVAAVFVAGIVVAVFLSGNLYLQGKKKYLDRINAMTISLENQTRQVDKMLLAVDMIRGRQDAGGDVLELLSEVHRSLPRGVYLTSLELERKGVIAINGRAGAMSDVFAFAGALEKMPFLSGVKNTYSAVRQDNGGEFVDFGITAGYKAPGNGN